MPKHVLIIGGSDGIGRECAALLAENGAHVTNVSRTPSVAAHENTLCDVTDAAFPDTVRSILREDPDIDTVLYSAGFSMAAPVEYIESADMRYLFEVDFFGFAECARAALPFLRERKGTIGAIGSLGGVLPIAFDAYYSAAKSALNMFVRELAMEVAPLGVKAFCVMPGGTATDFTFKRKLYDAAKVGAYALPLRSSVHTLAMIEQSGAAPRKVAQTIVSAVLAAEKGSLKKPVPASGALNKFLAFSVKIMPDRWTDVLANRLYALRIGSLRHAAKCPPGFAR